MGNGLNVNIHPSKFVASKIKEGTSHHNFGKAATKKIDLMSIYGLLHDKNYTASGPDLTSF